MTPYYEEPGITIYHGDCREILPHLPKADLVLTDPPYSEHTHNKQWIGAALTSEAKPRISTAHKCLGFDAITPELRLFVCREAARLCEKWSLFFSDVESAHLWKHNIEIAGLEYVRTCFWDKVDSAPQFTGDRPAASVEAIVCAYPTGKKSWNGGGRRNLFRHSVNGTQGPKPHPSTKPLPLMTELVFLFSNPDDLIFDPFMGSGTTLVAAKTLGREAIGVEIEEKYCAIAVERLRQDVLPFDTAPERTETQEALL